MDSLFCAFTILFTIISKVPVKILLWIVEKKACETGFHANISFRRIIEYFCCSESETITKWVLLLWTVEKKACETKFHATISFRRIKEYFCCIESVTVTKWVNWISTCHAAWRRNSIYIERAFLVIFFFYHSTLLIFKSR